MSVVLTRSYKKLIIVLSVYLSVTFEVKMNFCEYVAIKTNKIKYKQFELDFISDAIARNSDRISATYDKILLENGLSADKVRAVSGIVPVVQEKVEPDAFSNELFKRLAVVTHPDKNVESNDFVPIYAAYAKNDAYTLIEYAIKHNVMPNSSCDDAMFVMLEKKLCDINKEITQFKNTVQYKLLMYESIDSDIVMIKKIIQMTEENEILRERNNVLREVVNK